MRISKPKIRYRTISMCMLKNRQKLEEDEKSPNILENLWVVAEVTGEIKKIVQPDGGTDSSREHFWEFS